MSFSNEPSFFWRIERTNSSGRPVSERTKKKLAKCRQKCQQCEGIWEFWIKWLFGLNAARRWSRQWVTKKTWTNEKRKMKTKRMTKLERKWVSERERDLRNKMEASLISAGAFPFICYEVDAGKSKPMQNSHKKFLRIRRYCFHLAGKKK